MIALSYKAHFEVNVFAFGIAASDLYCRSSRWPTGKPKALRGRSKIDEQKWLRWILPDHSIITSESDELVGTPRLDFEGWRAILRASCGNQPEVIDRDAFSGWIRPLSVCGLAAAALKIECGSVAMDRNAYHSERTYRDVRFAGVDYYYAAFQLAGKSVFTQNDRVAQLAVGDVVLLEAARPAACFADQSQWLRLQLPRQSPVSTAKQSVR